MNKKVYLCDIEALKEGTNDKYGVSATLVFNKGLTYKELEQVIDERYFYLSNNNLQEEIEDLKADYGSKAQVERDILQDKIDKAIEEIDYLIGNCDLTNYQGQKIKNILRGENDGGL